MSHKETIMSNMIIVIISALMLLSLQGTVAEWRVSVELLNYTAPAVNLTGHSNNCDSRSGHGLHRECDPVFHVCQGFSSNLTCSDTEAYNDTNSILFGADGSALFAPHVFAHMPQNYVLNIWVRDQDDGNHSQTSVHFHKLTFPKSTMIPGSIIPVVTQQNEYRLALNLVVQCNPPSVGPHCECTPYGNVLCDATTGHHHCAPGFTGNQCTNSTAACTPYTCHNAGTCEEVAGSAVCHCYPGYGGNHCQTNINECAHVTCQNGGTCVDDINGYLCQCTPGFLGTHCEAALNTTEEEVVCLNGGTKLTWANKCECPDGYLGAACNFPATGCLVNPCQNGGHCVFTASGVHCECSFGFTGANCETDLTDPCANYRCRHGGTCHAILGIGPYCICQAGYKGDNCEVLADECSSSPCQNGGTCVDGVNFFTCTCPAGFVGTSCENAIDDSMVG